MTSIVNLRDGNDYENTEWEHYVVVSASGVMHSYGTLHLAYGSLVKIRPQISDIQHYNVEGAVEMHASMEPTHWTEAERDVKPSQRGAYMYMELGWGQVTQHATSNNSVFLTENLCSFWSELSASMRHINLPQFFSDFYLVKLESLQEVLQIVLINMGVPEEDVPHFVQELVTAFASEITRLYPPAE